MSDNLNRLCQIDITLDNPGSIFRRQSMTPTMSFDLRSRSAFPLCTRLWAIPAPTVKTP